MRWIYAALACVMLFLAFEARAEELYGPPDEVAVSEPAGIAAEEMVIGDQPEELVPMAELADQERAAKRAKERRNQRAIIPGLIAHFIVQGADTWSTIECGRPDKRCIEVNAPGLYGRKPKAKRVIPIKLAVTGLTALLAWEVSKKSPVAGYALLIAIDVPTTHMVLGNIKLIR